jgi:nucleoside-diphosphate-sugar epimerase
MIAVTGATGLVGTHLLAALIKENQPIKAFYRTEAKRDESINLIFEVYEEKIRKEVAHIKWVQLDILDINDLSEHLSDVTYLYHCAGKISNKPAEIKKTRKINIEGTANVMNMALKKNIKKVCHVSSVAALGHNDKEKIDENSIRDNNKKVSNYSIAKYGAEMEAWRVAEEGLPIIIINPSIIIGEGFYHSGSGQLLQKVKSGTNFYVEKVGGFVDVQDVISAMIMLMKSDIEHKRFIISAENKSIKEFMEDLALALNQKPPQFKLSKTLLYIFWLIEIIIAFLGIKKRVLTLQMINELNNKSYYDNSRIKKTINFQFTPINETLKRVAKHLSHSD